MELSTEQTRAVMHGIDDKLSWHELERPAGPQPVPAWCKGAYVYWADGYCNSPSVKLKVVGNVRDWPGKVFKRTGSRYTAEHEDGRMEQYAHDGAVGLHNVELFKRADGSLHKVRRHGEPEWTAEPFGYEPGDWVQAPVLATTKQQGFGGAIVWVTLDDGRELALRGPWHVGAPQGFTEVAFVNMEDRFYPNRQRPWHARGGIGGLYLRDETFVRIMARFLPHLPLASVTYGGATTLEPFKAEWGEPKRLVLEREWQAKKAAREAAKAVA